MRDNRRSNRRDFSRRRDGDGPTMHSAICDNCGRKCQVPFKPTGDKPVYCSDCYEDLQGAQSSGRDRDFRRSDRNDRGDRGIRTMFSATCDECGKKCDLPFRPSSDKPVYCDDCFGKHNKRRGEGGIDISALQEQMNVLETKLDMVLRYLDGSKTVRQEKAKPEVAKEVKGEEEVEKEESEILKQVEEVKKPKKKAATKKKSTSKK